jgi:hypothetical protein
MANRSADATVPAHDAVVVVPNDNTVIPVTRGLYVGVSGNITVRMIDQAVPYNTTGNTVTFTAVPVGILPVQVDKILSSGTTASSILALY